MKQDFVAVIVKIAFGKKSKVYPDKYIAEMRNGKRKKWNTPRKYKHLDGKEKKLILYDRTRKAVTVEVEIESVKRTYCGGDYPWTNKFAAGTLKVYQKSIPAEKIRRISGFSNFGVHRKDRSPIRNLNHEQYAAITELNRKLR